MLPRGCRITRTTRHTGRRKTWSQKNTRTAYWETKDNNEHFFLVHYCPDKTAHVYISYMFFSPSFWQPSDGNYVRNCPVLGNFRGNAFHSKNHMKILLTISFHLAVISHRESSLSAENHFQFHSVFSLGNFRNVLMQGMCKNFAPSAVILEKCRKFSCIFTWQNFCRNHWTLHRKYFLYVRLFNSETAQELPFGSNLENLLKFHWRIISWFAQKTFTHTIKRNCTAYFFMLSLSRY